ncbi:magnesium/cobalt transporter CorA [Candidatus Poribacteria bacterium]|nr:magnesium/cobalt transporter CorA [Candidatus Poribacteria bacterium]
MRLFKKRYSPPGTPPGTLIPKEVPRGEIKITVISYSPDEYEELEAKSAEECFEYVGKRDVTWINVDGTHDAELLRNIGERFGFHSLSLEDVINVGQRPKVEEFDDYIFITASIPQNPRIATSINLDEINIFLGLNFVMTIQNNGDVFEPIRQRIKENRVRIRKMKADYLAYSLIDLVVDQYFPVMEFIGEEIEATEDEMLENPSHEMVRKIREMKRELILIRSAIWPMREVINCLQRGEPELIAETTQIYLRDIYDHTIQIAELVESYRDILSEVFNVYLSTTANSTNEVMKILTIFSAIFIPLTFIVGIYGMNFEFIPELKWRPAYFILHGVMVAIVLVMLRFFRKRGWM